MFVSLPIHDCPSLCPSGITGMSSVASPSKDFTIPEGVHVMLIEYSRSDAEFEACLADEPSLQQCLDELNRAGHGVHREATDPKLYVERDLVVPITNKLTKEGVLLHGVRVFWQGLRCRHVVASEAYYSTVQSTVAKLRKKCKARVRCEVRIDLTNDDVSDETAASGSMHPQQHPVSIAPLCLREGENGFEDKGQRHIESFEAATKCSVNIQIDVDEEQDEEDDIFTENDEDDAVVADLNRMDNWIRFPRCCSYLDMKDHEYDELDPLYRCIFVENFDEPDPVIIQLHLMLTNERYGYIRNGCDMHCIHMLVRDLNAERCHNTEYWQHWQYYWDSWMEDNLL